MKRLLDCSVTWPSMFLLASEFCRLCKLWKHETHLIHVVKQVLQDLASVGSDPARLLKKHMLLSGLRDSPNSTAPQPLSLSLFLRTMN